MRNLEAARDRLSFDVSEVGVPVLVRTSYFPNWKVDGAEGPYRVSPNLMVVIPTSTHVELRYGWTPLDVLAYLLTALGIGLAVWLSRQPPIDVDRAARRRDEATPADGEPEPDSADRPPLEHDREPETQPVALT